MTIGLAIRYWLKGIGRDELVLLDLGGSPCLDNCAGWLRDDTAYANSSYYAEFDGSRPRSG